MHPSKEDGYVVRDPQHQTMRYVKAATSDPEGKIYVPTFKSAFHALLTFFPTIFSIHGIIGAYPRTIMSE